MIVIILMYVGTAIVATVYFYTFHCFVLGARNYPFSIFVNIIMIPLITCMSPIFITTTTTATATAAGGNGIGNGNGNGNRNGQQQQQTILQLFIHNVFIFLHSMSLLVTSPLVIIYLLPYLMNSNTSSNNIIGIFWYSPLTLYYELETFHLKYFFLLYVPLHMMICGITWSRVHDPTIQNDKNIKIKQH